MNLREQYQVWVNSEPQSDKGPTEKEFKTALQFCDDFMEQCDELDKENQELQDQYRWRDVNEELPKNNQVVLVRFYSGSIYPMIYKESESIHYFEDDIDFCRYEVSDLTHWQPMPEFKQKGSGDD